MPLDENSTKLLVEHQGKLQPVYDLVIAVEAGAWNLVVQSCRRFGVGEDFAAGCYCQAMAWAQSLTASI